MPALSQNTLVLAAALLLAWYYQHSKKNKDSLCQKGSRDVITVTTREVETIEEGELVKQKVDRGLLYFQSRATINTIDSHEDIVVRYAVLNPSGASKGVVLFFTGWSESMIKYGDFFQEMNEKGYTIVSIDHRSQGLSSRRLLVVQEELQHLKTHVEDFHEHLVDAVSVYSQVIAPLKPLKFFIMGFSLGGLVAAHMSTLVKNDGLILIAPCLQPKTGYPATLLQMVTWLMRKAGRGENFVPGHPTGKDHTMLMPPNSRVSSSSARIQFWQRMRMEQAELCINGMSVAHLDELIKARLNPTLTRRVLSTQVLLFSAELDAFVEQHAIDAFHRDLPPRVISRHVRIRGAKHELLHEREEIRSRVLTEIDAFLAKQLEAY
jgi:lysophospholipase